MTLLHTRGLRVDLGGRAIVSDVDITVGSGEVVGLVGPNGSGKTTVLRALYRAHEPSAGTVEVEGQRIGQLSRRRLARILAATVQEPADSAALSVREVVAQGRVAHLGLLQPMGVDDRDAVAEALEATGLRQFAERDVRTLSGGERQRVAIARALAQRPRALLLDEPTNHLDLRHQFGVLELVRQLATDGLGILLTLHDLRQAVRYCDRLVVLDGGTVAASGPPTDVVDADLLATVFGVHGELRPSGPTGVTLDVHGTV